MNALKSKIDLDRVRIASPCKADWNEMSGDERSRHCRECKLNVYNVAGLTKKEAEALLEKAAAGQRVCLRLSRRADGTIITKDCPVGVKLARRLKIRAAALRLSATTAFLWLFGIAQPSTARELMGKIAAPTNSYQQAAPVNNNLDPDTEETMGDIAEPDPQPTMGEPAVAPLSPQLPDNPTPILRTYEQEMGDVEAED
jgi:hypothetical protein